MTRYLKKHKVPLKASFDEYGDVQVKIDVDKPSKKSGDEEGYIRSVKAADEQAEKDALKGKE